jgi:hypothetical protein
MHQLMRRAALGLALPLVVGAPVVLLPSPAHAMDPVVHVITSEEASLYGQIVTATAEVTDGEAPVVNGFVQFTISRPSHQDAPFGDPIPLDSTGKATTPPLTQVDGRPLEVSGGISDTWSIGAVYYEEPDMPTPFADTVTLDVSKAGSSLAVLPTATTLVADLNGELPGGALETSLRPDGGAVHFVVDGVEAGTNDAVNGTATLDYVLPPGSHTISASYTGDDHYLPASPTSATRKDPLLTARVLSFYPKTRSGWYGSAVEVWFVCRPQGSELVEDCPEEVTLRKSGKDQSVTQTIHAVDGGFATVTVSGIDIDRVKPKIKINGRTCSATDKLSGLKGGCRMTIGANGHYRAVAVDKAGNRAVKRGVLD